MKSFSDLYTNEFEISEIVAINQHWQSETGFTMKSPRPNNALLFFVGCRGEYRKNHHSEIMQVPKGSVFFIPENSCYDWIFYDADNSGVSTVLFEFALIDTNGGRIVLEDADTVSLENESVRAFFTKLVNDFSRPRPIPVKLKATAYELISHLLDSQRKNTIKSDFKCIYKGIKYLEDDPVQDKSVAELAELCNVSVNYFERLFKEYSGFTPTAYRIKRKLERAKVLLSVGDMTVQQVATELGFYDTAYFCRVFKKAFGITPSQYR